MHEKLAYTKTSRNVDLKPAQAEPCRLTEGRIATTQKKVPLSYSKEDGKIAPRLICVISGGTDRERALLNEVERRQTFTRLTVVFVSSKTAPLQPGGLTPKMMKSVYDDIKHSGKITLHNRTVNIADIDSLYLFTDVDHYYDELKAILSNASEQERAEWIISNPDIEIWIYYCYRNDPQSELQEVINAFPESQRSSVLKTVNGRFNNGGGLDTRKTFEHLEEGIANSMANFAVDDNGIPMLLSTQMHLFAQDVVTTLDEEYKQWKRLLKDRKLRYHKN